VKGLKIGAKRRSTKNDLGCLAIKILRKANGSRPPLTHSWESVIGKKTRTKEASKTRGTKKDNAEGRNYATSRSHVNHTRARVKKSSAPLERLELAKRGGKKRE